jgi:hypothetical protein
MSSLKRKRNLLDDKHKREIISYAKENPELIQQQIADNLTIKWDLFIRMSLYNCKMYVSRVETIWESLSFHLITWLPVFNVPQFIAKLVIPPNYQLHRRWRFNEGALYMVCPAISSYSFGVTALIFCMMFIHIMEVCMSTGFWFSSNIW